MHAYQKTAHATHVRRHATGILLRHVSARQLVDIVRHLTPSPQIEVPNAEIGTFHTDIGENSMKSFLELRFDIVKYLGHVSHPSAARFRERTDERIDQSSTDMDKQKGRRPNASIQTPLRHLARALNEDEPRRKNAPKRARTCLLGNRPEKFARFSVSRQLAVTLIVSAWRISPAAPKFCGFGPKPTSTKRHELYHKSVRKSSQPPKYV